MANNFKKNIEYLKRYSPILQAVAGALETFEDKEEAVVLHDGILYFSYEGNYYRVHSENRLEEAKHLMSKVDINKDQLILLFGVGNPALLRRLLTETSEGTRVMVFEPNAYVFKYILVHENLKDVITSGKFAFIFGDDLNINRGIVYALEQKWDNLAQNTMVISSPNYYLYSEFRLTYIRRVSEKIDMILKNLGTSLEDMLDGFSNHYQNVDACLAASGIEEVRGKYEGYPAIIVASGPSLDKNIQYLKEAQGKALIIACDASYKACMENGVRPDAIASIERYSPTFQFFYEGRVFDENVVMVGPTLLWPEIYKVFPGKKILMAKSPIGLEGWWSSHFEQIEFVDLGMSCANTAYALAKEAGCSTVILIGQDLAFTDEKIHSDSAHTKFEGPNVGWREEGCEDIWVDEINGGKVRTNMFYNLFRYFFEERTSWDSLELVDATEGGALIRGTHIMTFQEAIAAYCTREIPFALNSLLKERIVKKADKLEKYGELILAAEKTIEKLMDVKKQAVEHYDKLMKYVKFDYDNATEVELTKMVLNMESANEIVTYIVEKNRDLVSYYQQIIKQTIIYVKKIGNDLTGENVKRNWELQLNLMYMLDVATIATVQRFEQMICFMHEKQKEIEKEETADE